MDSLRATAREGRLITIGYASGTIPKPPVNLLLVKNMSILGLTIDYGPFSFLDAYDPSFTPNITDLQNRRYCYSNQPSVGLWNLAQLLNALTTAEAIGEDDCAAREILKRRLHCLEYLDYPFLPRSYPDHPLPEPRQVGDYT